MGGQRLAQVALPPPLLLLGRAMLPVVQGVGWAVEPV